MRKCFLAAFVALFTSAPWLQAQTASPRSGVYQNLTLGVAPSGDLVTGYYRLIDDPPNLPSSECLFYFSGQRQGEKYALQVWRPGAKNSATTGELKIFAGENIRASALLRLDQLSRDCTALNPKLGKPEGALLDKSKGGPWTEVRVVGDSKSHYFQTPEPGSPERGSARRGTVLLVTTRQPGWVQVQVDQKPKGWIPEADLYPLHPVEEMPERAELQANAKPIPEPQPKPMPAPESKALPKAKASLDSKADLLRRLKALDAQAFALALQALARPGQRSALDGSRLELETELNALVEGLDKVDPAAYRSESSRIYETYLDLQFARQEQAVVSLRLRQEILKNK